MFRLWTEAAIFGAVFLVLLVLGSTWIAPDTDAIALLPVAVSAMLVRGGLGCLGWRWVAASGAGFAGLLLLHTMQPALSPSGDMVDMTMFWPVALFMQGVPLGLLAQAAAWGIFAGLLRSGQLPEH